MRTRSRAVALLLFDEVDLLDAAAVLAVLSEAGRRWNFRAFAVTPVAVAPGRVASRAQLSLEVPSPLAALEAPELVVVPGGYGARRAAEDPRVVEWLARAGAASETVLGVGTGLLLLARAGLLGDACVATPPDLRAELAALCPTATLDASLRTAESGRFVTAARGAGALDAALVVVARALGEASARAVAASLGIPWAGRSAAVVQIVLAEGAPPAPPSRDPRGGAA